MLATPPTDSKTRSDEDLNFELNWAAEGLRPKPGIAAISSLIAHLLLAGLMIMAPRSLFESNPAPLSDTPKIERKVTPLIAPRMELTQKAPNKGPIKQEVNLDDLRANMKAERAPRTYIPPPTPSRKAEPSPKQIEAPPQILNSSENKQLAQIGTPQLPPPIQPQEQPKRSPFENVGQPSGAKQGAPDGRIPQVPKQSIDEMMKQGIQGTQGTSGVVVTDLPSPSNPADPQKKIGSSLELLSDPQGVDFRPYLAKILAIVRRNWFAVIPESARFGRQGKTMIQFSIDREGRIPKLVISGPSGTEALDRAAVAGISASNPLPPLPPDFKGDIVRLQFGFSYNVR